MTEVSGLVPPWWYVAGLALVSVCYIVAATITQANIVEIPTGVLAAGFVLVNVGYSYWAAAVHTRGRSSP